MSSSAVPPRPLATGFPPVTRQQWRDLVTATLSRGGKQPPADPEASLTTKTYDPVSIRPLYTAGNTPELGLPGVAPFVRSSTAASSTGAVDGWEIRQRHAHRDAQAGNAAILTDLENGVNGLWIHLGVDGTAPAELAALLSGVMLDRGGVTLSGDVAGAKSFVHREYGQDRTHGARMNLSLPATPTALELAEPVDPSLRSFVVDGLEYHGRGASDVQELGLTLAAGVAFLRLLTAAGFSLSEANAQLEFRLAATAEQFTTIAKFRAGRILWSRVTELSGQAQGARQHAVTSPAMLTVRDPWVNILRGTIASFAAGVGGAQAVTVLPFDAAIGAPDDLSLRIARNTQSILIEESHVSAVVDAAGGSYYVEQLTEDLAAAAWAWFTELERAGGITAATELIDSALAETKALRDKDIAHRKFPITGVSEFPNLAERKLDRPPAAPLAEHRYAEQFEQLRALSDGTAPTVFLATIGSVSEHTARASFATNLFATAGITAISTGKFADSGTNVAVVCGTDAAYAEQAAQLAGELRGAGAQHVILAGRPRGEYVNSFDEAIFLGCDVLAIVTKTLDVVGAAR